MTAYRTSEKPALRVATIAIARPRSWRIGIIFGAGLFAIELALALYVPTSSRFTCRRDDAGHGSCEYVRHFVYGDSTRRWDVTSLRNAHVITADYKGKPTYRLMAAFDNQEVRILTSKPAEEQRARADRINAFVSDTSQHEVELYDSMGMNLLAFAAALVGLGIALGTIVRFPARRVVLDDGDKVARFERRAWTRWRAERSLPLADLDSIVAEIASKKPAHDRAITEVRAFCDEPEDDQGVDDPTH